MSIVTILVGGIFVNMEALHLIHQITIAAVDVIQVLCSWKKLGPVDIPRGISLVYKYC